MLPAHCCQPQARRPPSLPTPIIQPTRSIRRHASLSLRIGPGVSVIGHDDLPTSELLDPPTGDHSSGRREMGRALMARLLAQAPPDDFAAPVELVERASLQAPEIPSSCRFTWADGRRVGASVKSVTALDTSADTRSACQMLNVLDLRATSFADWPRGTRRAALADSARLSRGRRSGPIGGEVNRRQ